uniref:ZP domain-containing protein n=1 Tax=Parascaris univalens TaxID=6257 RepID=A0A914ZE00_PARUN
MAGQEAHIYKYADRSQLFYQCQITITIKEPGSECPKPTCSEPEGFGALKSGQIEEIKFDRARLIRKRAIDDENTLDVRTEINTLEIIDQDIALPTHLQHLLQTNARQHIVNSQSLDGACMSPLAILLFLVTGVTIVATVLAATLLHVSTHKP